MNVSNSVAKQRSTPVRLLNSAAWSLVFVIGFWVLTRSWREGAVLAVGFCYLAVYGALSDRLSLRSRFLVVLPLFIGLIIGIFLVA